MATIPKKALFDRNRAKSFALAIPVILVGAAFPAEAADINGNWAR